MIHKFIHLRLHTEYSIVDSLIRINNILSIAKKDNQPAIAITDLSNIFGAIKFYEKAISKGIKPIIGCDIWITNDKNKNKPFRLLLLIKNYNGYLQICNLLTKSWLKNLNNNKAEVKIEWFDNIKNEKNSNIIALSGAHLGNIGISINNGDIKLAEKQAKIWKKIFKENFYIEIQRIQQKNMELQVLKSVEIAHKLNLPIVATHPIQFQSKNDFIAHEIRVCIANNQFLNNEKRKKYFTKEQNFKTQKEMNLLFYDIPEAIQNSIEIAKKCNLKLCFKKTFLPVFKTNNINVDDILKQNAYKGLKNKLNKINLNNSINIKNKKKNIYIKRLNYEINTIIKMKFSSYFLIVADFINWAKKNNIPVGPGRGSGASSLVAYSLNITSIDPIKYNLLFERFLNEERSSIPDFDIDFCQEKRDIVIKYVKKKYGKKSVAQIATFGTMAAKGVIRDVGRVLGLSYNLCDKISKLIPFKPGKLVTIKSAIKDEFLLREQINNNKDIKQLINLAKQIEGIIRNISTHAGGIIIAPDKLTNFCPLYCQEKNSTIVTQYDKDDIKKIGLLKFDFLGLTTLTIIDKTILNIKKSIKNFNINEISLNDKKTYSLLSQAKTIAIFQFESQGMQKMLKKAIPNKFEDIIALISLYRPGPIELVNVFLKRKMGEKFNLPDPRMKNILLDTYGIMIYQEQIMQIAKIIGGFSLKKADLLQRAMSSKKIKEISNNKLIFINKAKKNNLSKKKAKEIFNLMEKFSGYGFNKSHATAYALISYYTAYLKSNHTIEFMAANLSLAMNEKEKIKILIQDSINICKIKILPPNINTSNYYFEPIKCIKSNKIIFGLGAIKGLGKNVIKSIINERKNGIFKNLFDFIKRVDKHYINRKILNAFISSGSFDCFKISRPIMYELINIVIINVKQIKNSINQINLFEKYNTFEISPEYKNKALKWGTEKILEEEKNVLGFYLSNHPFNIYKKEINRFINKRILNTKYKEKNNFVIISGIIINIKNHLTIKEKTLIITIDNSIDITNIIINNNIYKNIKDYFKIGNLIIVYGKKIRSKICNFYILAKKIIDLESARIKYGKKIIIKIYKKISILKLKKILFPFCKKNGIKFIIKYITKNYIHKFKFDLKLKVIPKNKLILSLRKINKIKSIKIKY